MWSSYLPFVLLQLAGLVLASPLATAACDGPLPTWTISGLKIKSKDSVGTDGRAYFTVKNELTGKSDDLSCVLVANYRCEINGVPSDATLKINLQSQMETVHFSLSQSCGDNALKSIVGNADLEMTCTAEHGGDSNCAMDPATIKGDLLELAPGRK